MSEKPRRGSAPSARHALERMDQCGNGAGQTALHIAGAAAIELIVPHGRPERRRVCIPAIAQGDGIHVADVDESRLIAHARHGDHKVAAPGEYFELAYLCGVQHGRIEFGNIRLDQAFDVSFDLALIRTWVRAVNPHKVLRKPPGKVLINHMQPHNQSAFQTDCKPPERFTTCR